MIPVAWVEQMWLVVVVLTVMLQKVVDGATINMTVNQGMLTGLVLERAGDNVPEVVNVFYGVPYAKPPVGDLRFQRPQPADGWEGVKDATKMPASCWQSIDAQFDRFPGVEMWNPNTNMSEDCLYLNIWIPTNPAPKAILVWIYGGGFWAGTSTLNVYNPRALAARERVIVVSLNYRLGPLGFFYTGTQDSPGNVGLLDQVMALRWIKDNAFNLGGDPNKIMIFGESAGATSVGYHMLSPLSMDLFTNAALMSGSPLVSWGIQSYELATGRGKTLASSLGCPDDDVNAMLSCLRQVDPGTLTDKQWELTMYFFDVPIGPVVDGYFLPRHPFDSVADGMVKNTSIIAGVVRDEGTFWVLYGFQQVFGRRDPNPVSASQYTTVVGGVLQAFGPSYTLPTVKSVVEREYYDSFPPWRRPSYLDAIDDLSGDLLFKCPVVNFAKTYKNMANNNVYLYSFEHRVSSNPWPMWLGVSHGYELELVFGLPWLHPSNYSADDRNVSHAFMKRIAAFAKTGNPNSEITGPETSWPLYTHEEQKYMVFEGQSRTVKQGLRYDACTFWNTQFPIISEPSSAPSCTSAGQSLSSLGVAATLLGPLLVAFILHNAVYIS